VVLRFVDIGEIVNHHCLNFLFSHAISTLFFIKLSYSLVSWRLSWILDTMHFLIIWSTRIF